MNEKLKLKPKDYSFDLFDRNELVEEFVQKLESIGISPGFPCWRDDDDDPRYVPAVHFLVFDRDDNLSLGFDIYLPEGKLELHVSNRDDVRIPEGADKNHFIQKFKSYRSFDIDFNFKSSEDVDSIIAWFKLYYDKF